jgi:hypothetical protein
MTTQQMKKYSIGLIILLISIIAGFYLWTAREAKKKSDDLLSRFEKVERSLSYASDSTPNSMGVGAVQQIYPISSLKSQIILLIDSLKENFEIISDSSKTTQISKRLHSDFKRLIQSIRELNKLKWDMVDSKIPDTINYWARSDEFSEKKWITTFDKTTKEGIVTYLNHLRNETLSTNY